MKTTLRVCPPCPQCGEASAHITLLSRERHYCCCDACGFTWNEPRERALATAAKHRGKRRRPELST